MSPSRKPWIAPWLQEIRTFQRLHDQRVTCGSSRSEVLTSATLTTEDSGVDFGHIYRVRTQEA
jgi:hypothetical protein